jgi:hypothetical protein
LREAFGNTASEFVGVMMRKLIAHQVDGEAGKLVSPPFGLI